MIRNGQFLWDWKASHCQCIFWMSARPIHVVAFHSCWFTLTPYFGYIILPHVDWPAQCLVQRNSKRNIQTEKIETDKRRKHFFHTFLYLLGEWTNQRYVPRHSVVPKTPDSKMMLLVRRTLPDKTRFTENLSIYLSPPAPNSPLQNPSNFGATASHWLLYFLLFFFFLILTEWMRGALCVATCLYILYVAADESTSGWEFYC